MNGSVIREPPRSLKEQFSRSSEAWKEQSDRPTRSFGSGQRETGGASRSLVSAPAVILAVTPASADARFENSNWLGISAPGAGATT